MIEPTFQMIIVGAVISLLTGGAKWLRDKSRMDFISTRLLIAILCLVAGAIYSHREVLGLDDYLNFVMASWASAVGIYEAVKSFLPREKK